MGDGELTHFGKLNVYRLLVLCLYTNRILCVNPQVKVPGSGSLFLSGSLFWFWLLKCSEVTASELVSRGCGRS